VQRSKAQNPQLNHHYHHHHHHHHNLLLLLSFLLLLSIALQKEICQPNIIIMISISPCFLLQFLMELRVLGNAVVGKNLFNSGMLL
jgi:hypothetical protein